MGGRFKGRCTALVAPCLVALVFAPAAHAAFPGQNGKIAFQVGDTIQVINPDGTGRATLTTGSNPTWSPDGTRIAFLRSDGLYVAFADGSGATRIVEGGNEMNNPAWSPDGTRLAFGRRGACGGDRCFPSHLYITNTDGTGTYELQMVPKPARPAQPDWSPDGAKLVAVDELGDTFIPPRVFTVNIDGSDLRYLTGDSCGCEHPSWAPDASRILYAAQDFQLHTEGTLSMLPNGAGATVVHPRPILTPGAWAPDRSRIALAQCVDMTYPCPQRDLILVNPNGGGEVNITNDAAGEANPDWQPIPVNAYPHPKGASPMEVSLVPAYQRCAAPNRMHGPPLDSPSCSPPTQKPGQLTVGTPDANGQPAKSNANLRINPVRGNPTTPADEADVRLRATITDVRLRSDLSDYTGSLEVRLSIQITDKDNTPHPGGPGPATVQELTHSHPLPCAATADTTVGSTCQFDTTIEALVPGAVKELKRAIWELKRIRVHDGAGNLFMTSGVFVP